MKSSRPSQNPKTPAGEVWKKSQSVKLVETGGLMKDLPNQVPQQTIPVRPEVCVGDPSVAPAGQETRPAWTIKGKSLT
jgi:hypothetical protein